MGVCYDQAPPEIHEKATGIIARHHPELDIGGRGEGEYVRLCLLMAYRDDDSDDPPVKHDGYPCAAVISVIPYKQRVDKRADAEIILDQKLWDGLTDPQQTALLDHEITHLEVQVDEHGLVKTDDTGRPKLKLRNHDWQLGGFRSIAQRYGDDALEVIEARKFQDGYGDVTLHGANLFA